MMMIIIFSQVHSVFSTRYNDDDDDDTMIQWWWLLLSMTMMMMAMIRKKIGAGELKGGAFELSEHDGIIAWSHDGQMAWWFDGLTDDIAWWHDNMIAWWHDNMIAWWQQDMMALSHDGVMKMPMMMTTMMMMMMMVIQWWWLFLSMTVWRWWWWSCDDHAMIMRWSCDDHAMIMRWWMMMMMMIFLFSFGSFLPDTMMMMMADRHAYITSVTSATLFHSSQWFVISHRAGRILKKLDMRISLRTAKQCRFFLNFCLIFKV